MEKMNTRIFLLLSLVVVGLFLHSAWVKEHQKPVEKVQPQDNGTYGTLPTGGAELPDTPSAALEEGVRVEAALKKPGFIDSVPDARLIAVETDVYQLKIDRQGGDIVSLKLKQYPQSQETPDEGYELMANHEGRYYVAESGLLNAQGPDSPQNGSRALYLASESMWRMNDAKQLVVPLHYKTSTGIEIEKKFVFSRDNYIINVEYEIKNNSDEPYSAHFYGRLKRTAPVSKNGFLGAMKTYTGAGVYTPDKPYTKLPFDKIAEKPFKETVEGGWAAMIEHYFTSAWVPPKDEKNHYQTRKLAGDVYAIDMVGNALTVASGESKTIAYQLYAGPENTKVLRDIAKGLELTVDYGVLWFICQPIFWLLDHLHDLLGNWGWAIIFTTLIIKLLFYRLSASAYRSMGNMRKLQPKIEAMKQRFGDDKQKFGQAMMELYRKEKVNPLGGCLPILLQIPVFIALYWVLLESVELRQAPFMLWITDLSIKDPYYVLPLLMGASMFFQQRLSPTPPDPIQAKVMMFMPVFFTVLFLQFPAGLMLYWVANNVLSIIQQWAITRGIEKRSQKA